VRACRRARLPPATVEKRSSGTILSLVSFKQRGLPETIGSPLPSARPRVERSHAAPELPRPGRKCAGKRAGSSVPPRVRDRPSARTRRAPCGDGGWSGERPRGHELGESQALAGHGEQSRAEVGERLPCVETCVSLPENGAWVRSGLSEKSVSDSATHWASTRPGFIAQALRVSSWIP
jgi:hypothetical protein